MKISVLLTPGLPSDDLLANQYRLLAARPERCLRLYVHFLRNLPNVDRGMVQGRQAEAGTSRDGAASSDICRMAGSRFSTRMLTT
jgi:hypothetical protein